MPDKKVNAKAPDNSVGCFFRGLKREWSFCPVTLKHGDCLEVMKIIPDGSVDMILCDLPYGTTACKWDSIIPFERLWEQYNRIARPDTPIVLFAAQPFTTKLIHSNFKQFRYCWYWKKNYKTGFSYARYQPMRCIEDVCVFYRKAPTYNPQGLIELKEPIIRNKKGTTDSTIKLNEKTITIMSRYTNYPKHLLEFDNEVKNNRDRLHPTQKPVKLLEYLIRTYTNENDIVLDNCMGSGSTGIAAVNTNRRFYGIEKDDKYFDIAKQRIDNAVFSLQQNS